MLWPGNCYSFLEALKNKTLLRPCPQKTYMLLSKKYKAIDKQVKTEFRRWKQPWRERNQKRDRESRHWADLIFHLNWLGKTLLIKGYLRVGSERVSCKNSLKRTLLPGTLNVLGRIGLGTYEVTGMGKLSAVTSRCTADLVCVLLGGHGTWKRTCGTKLKTSMVSWCVSQHSPKSSYLLGCEGTHGI